MAIQVNLPQVVTEVLGTQGFRGDIFVQSPAEAVTLHLLASVLLLQSCTNKLLQEAAEREKERDKQVAALKSRAEHLAGALQTRLGR